jgi:hypothetical protein
MPKVIRFPKGLAVDGGFSEPLSRPNSLLTGEINREFHRLSLRLPATELSIFMNSFRFPARTAN